ncbi:MAG: molybdopterin synthase sulfur carrier subunit [Desulfobacca sp.]|nr:molybdopterin synthase sulfur carrier subunit [Desulfobacca sp.]
MKIQLNLFASLSRYLPEQPKSGFSNEMEIEDGITIKSLLEGLKVPGELPKIIFLNGIHADETALLKEGDRLGIFPPLAGG